MVWTPDFDEHDHGEPEPACTWCGGEGICWDAADDLSGACPTEPHNCHACRGSGNLSDQTVF